MEQLELALSEANNSARVSELRKTQTTPDHSVEGPKSLSPKQSIAALRIEDDGRLSFHGSTSLFQLPSSTHIKFDGSDHTADETPLAKESLVNSAWRERAYEKLADIPVQSFFPPWCWMY